MRRCLQSDPADPDGEEVDGALAGVAEKLRRYLHERSPQTPDTLCALPGPRPGQDPPDSRPGRRGGGGAASPAGIAHPAHCAAKPAGPCPRTWKCALTAARSRR